MGISKAQLFRKSSTYRVDRLWLALFHDQNGIKKEEKKTTFFSFLHKAHLKLGRAASKLHKSEGVPAR